MSLEQKIGKDLIEAMKAKDETRLRSVRAIKAAILLIKTDGKSLELDEESEIKLLQRLVKTRKDSLIIFEKQNREDLAKGERGEIAIIEAYLPQQLSNDAVEAIVKDIIAETGASTIKDMGKVIPVAMKALGGVADGKLISELVKRLLV